MHCKDVDMQIQGDQELSIKGERKPALFMFYAQINWILLNISSSRPTPGKVPSWRKESQFSMGKWNEAQNEGMGMLDFNFWVEKEKKEGTQKLNRQ